MSPLPLATRSTRLGVFGGVTAALLAITARAETPAASGVAEVLFQQARNDMRRGAFADAYSKLVESERIDPSSGTLLNLALCEERIGKIASAWLHARELTDRLEGNDERKPIAERLLASLRPRVPKLIVHVPKTTSDIQVALDGVPLGPSSIDVELPIDPGSHRVVSTAAERTPVLTSISIEEAQNYELTVVPGPPADPQASSSDSARSAALATSPVGSGATPPATSDHDPARLMDTSSGMVRSTRKEPTRSPARSATWLGWTAVGAGGAALVAGGVLGALTLQKRSEVEGECPQRACHDSKGFADASAGRALFAASVATLAAGTVGVGIGIYLLAGNSARAPSPLTGGGLGYTASF